MSSDGGCLSLWMKEPVSDKDLYLLHRYSLYLNALTHVFSLEARPKPTLSFLEKIQIYLTVGFIPKQEITVCGFVLPIFTAAEQITKEFGGYLSVVFELSPDSKKCKGRHYKILKLGRYRYPPRFFTYDLMDWEFIYNALNSHDSEEDREIFIIGRFRKIEERFPHAPYK